MHAEPTGTVLRDLDIWRHPAVLLVDGRITAASGPALEVLGADAIGGRFRDLVAADERDEAARLLGSVEIGPPVRIGLITSEGTCLVESSWVQLDGAGPPSTLVTWRDVTRGELLYMNDTLLRLRGERDRDDLPDGRNAIDHVAPGQSEIVEHLLDQLATSGRWRGQVMFNGVDGIVPVDAVIERSEVGGETVYSLIGRDVSAELLLRSELMDVIDEREGFLAHVAHEIRNPLSAVEGMALVLRDETELTESQREILDLMISGAAETKRVVEDLAGMASGASEPLRIASDVVDLGPVTRNVVDTIGTAHGVVITLTGVEMCVGDELRIRQVLRNLLINAIRYGGADIRVDVRRNDGRVEIEVSDDGDGVDEADAESIFENFSSAHDTVEESMGVGLAVSRQLTIGMGGAPGLSTTLRSYRVRRRSGRSMRVCRWI